MESGIPEPGFELASAAFMFSNKAIALAFRFAQNNLSSPGVLGELRGTKLVGTVSDSLAPNGLASQLDTTDGSSLHFMNVTAGAFFFPLALALHWKSLERPAAAYQSIQSPFLKKLDFPQSNLLLPDNVDDCVEAANIARCAFLATIYHELCHIVRGHTGWVASQFKHSELLEVSSKDPSVTDDYAKWRKLLETDADLVSGAYLSAFVARAAKREQESGTPAEDALLNQASRMLAGITLMYSWFARSSWYHGGLVRIHVVLIGLMHGLRELDKHNQLLLKLVPQVERLQKVLVELGLLPEAAANFSDGDAYELAHHTLVKIEDSDELWTAHSPLNTRPRSAV